MELVGIELGMESEEATWNKQARRVQNTREELRNEQNDTGEDA